MKRNIHTPLTDEYLKSIEGMKDAGASPFFYTKLKAKMEKQTEEKKAWIFQLKPAYIISMLLVFLSINSFVVITQVQSKKAETTNSTLKSFANTYNLTVSNY
jgi:hypothetical protein